MRFLKPLLGIVFSSVMALSAYAQQALLLSMARPNLVTTTLLPKPWLSLKSWSKYYGKPVNLFCTKQRIGSRKDYFAYMNQGKAVDYAIVSPAHMSTFSKAAPFIDAPFLFSDLAHWNKVLDQDLLKPIADEVEQKPKSV